MSTFNKEAAELVFYTYEQAATAAVKGAKTQNFQNLEEYMLFRHVDAAIEWVDPALLTTLI